MANSTIEKEAKMILSPETFELLRSLKPFRFISQDNYFYLTHDNKAFRFRIVEGQPITFTHKKKIDGGHIEYEKEVSKIGFDDPYIREVLALKDGEEPEFLGVLHTDRYLYKGQRGEFCLDKSEYLGICDYEFEYELFDPEDTYEEGMEFLKEAGVSYKENKVGKFARFYQRRKQLSSQ